jgi:hypothetical protein
VKATRSAEGEGGDAFSLFRLTSEHGRALLRTAAQVPVPPCRAIIQMSHFLRTGTLNVGHSPVARMSVSKVVCTECQKSSALGGPDPKGLVHVAPA